MLRQSHWLGLWTPSAMSRWSVGPQQPVDVDGIAQRQDLFDHLRLLLDCQELLGKVLYNVTELATLQDGALKK